MDTSRSIVLTNREKINTLLPIVLTNREEKNDGFGENFKNIILTMTYAEYKKLGFVYFPFKELCHSTDNTFVSKMEEVINLKNYVELNNQKNIEKYNVCYVPKLQLLHFFDNNISFFEKSNTLKLIKTAFKIKHINPWKIKSSGEINIAIHIRRCDAYDFYLCGDTNAISNFDGKTNIDRLNVPSNLYTLIIKQFLAAFPNCKIHIYSQSYYKNSEKEFNIYKSIDETKVILHINEELDKTFVSMVFADILVMSPSALSYVAALLSDNIIYYIPFSSPPLSHWNIVSGYNCSKKYNFLIKSVDICIDYDANTDNIIVTNLEEIKSIML